MVKAFPVSGVTDPRSVLFCADWGHHRKLKLLLRTSGTYQKKSTAIPRRGELVQEISLMYTLMLLEHVMFTVQQLIWWNNPYKKNLSVNKLTPHLTTSYTK